MKMEEIQRVGRRCPCGKMVYGYNRKLKRPQEYCHGHDQLGKKHSYVKSGKDNPSYKGAACKTTRHYIKTQKPKPDHCERCGILEIAIKITKMPGRAKSKLLLSKINKTPDPNNPKDWLWLCHICRFPRAAKFGKLSDHLCECPLKPVHYTLYGWDGEPNQYIVGHNAAGKMLQSKYKPGVRSDRSYRARMYAWARLHLKKPIDGKCQKCNEEPIWKPYSIGLKFLRKISDWQWIGRECYRVAG